MNIKNVGWAAAFLCVFASGFILGRSGIETPLNNLTDDAVQVIEQRVADTDTQNTNANEPLVSSGTSASTESEKGGISDGQRKMLESFGLNPDEVTLTPAMIACAEAKVGKGRVAEIVAGATPSIMEGASFVTCYK